MITVNYLKIKKSQFKYIEPLLNSVPVKTKRKLLKFHLKEDRLRGAIARLILKKQLMDCGYPKSILNKIKVDEFDRPSIDAKIDFNISHSGNYVICAISKKSRVGVDIEKIKKVRLDGFNVFLSKSELTKLQSLKDASSAFFTLWTQKEAVSKADGKGLGTLLPDIKIKGKLALCHKKKWNLTKLNIDDKYVSYIAYKGAQKISITELSLNRLLNSKGN